MVGFSVEHKGVRSSNLEGELWSLFHVLFQLANLLDLASILFD